MADFLKEVAPAHAVPIPSPLYLGGKRKTDWILGKELKPTESDPKFDEWVSNNCIILGWMFNSMEDRVYHMFMYHDTVHGLWIALTQIWEELAQYEPLSDFLILNTSPLPSLYEAFATMDGDEQRRRLLPSPSESPIIVLDQRAFAASSGTHLYCQHCRKPGHLIDRCFILHPELKQQFFRPRGGGRSGGRGRGLAPAFPSSSPAPAIVAKTPTALHGKSGHPTWILDSGANNHMTGELATFTSPITSVNQSDLTSKKIFGKRYEQDGLYYFGDPLPSTALSSSLHVFSPSVPKYFWHMAVLTATYLINRTPSRVLQGKAPLHILKPASTLFSIIPRVFGCTCFVQNRSPIRTKLDDKAVRLYLPRVFLDVQGYSPNFEILAVDDPIPPRPLPILDPSPPTPNDSLPPIDSQDPSPHTHAPLLASSLESGMSSPLVTDIPPPRYPTHVHRPPSRFLLLNSTNHPIAQYLFYHGLLESYKPFLSQVDSILLPRSIHEAF
ncbi:hypothetical protein Acr_07g0017530 [Actinidia rufa]|uniref:Uncharacterized protein n=1 Tax=Actinidia rufa TaxID=165716 RepID=A0A7J0F110_9ERIC|nr:hypothetical protein Acr_07g0017530 [Actinidia rufa]